MDLELCVVTWVNTTIGSYRFREKFIVKLPFYIVNLLPCGLFGLNPPRFFTLKLHGFIGFLQSSYHLSSLLFYYCYMIVCVLPRSK